MERSRATASGRRASGTSKLQRSLPAGADRGVRWQQDGVDDVDHAIRRHDVRSHYLRAVKEDLAIAHDDVERKTVDRGRRGAVRLDDVTGQHLSRYDVIGEDGCAPSSKARWLSLDLRRRPAQCLRLAKLTRQRACAVSVSGSPSRARPSRSRSDGGYLSISTSRWVRLG